MPLEPAAKQALRVELEVVERQPLGMAGATGAGKTGEARSVNAERRGQDRGEQEQCRHEVKKGKRE
eukprot:2894669-Pyramimonas_sp.AAC.1